MLIHLIVLTGWVTVDGRSLGVVTGIVGTILTVVGFETLSLGLHAKTYSWSRRFSQDNQFLRKFYRLFKLEAGLLLGTTMFLLGSVILARSVMVWLQSSLLPLPNPEWVSFAATLIIVGLGTVFSSLFISSMSMQKVEIYEQK